MTLMERLVEAGYPESDMSHHCSDLYVYCTPLTKRVIDEWLKDNGYKKRLFVSTFTDQVTGEKMYDVAFQYTPWWSGDRRI